MSKKRSSAEGLEESDGSEGQRREKRKRELRSPIIDRDVFDPYREAMLQGITARAQEAMEEQENVNEKIFDQGSNGAGTIFAKTPHIMSSKPSEPATIPGAGLWKPFWKNVEGRTQAEILRAENMIKAKWPIPSRPSISPLTPPPRSPGEEESGFPFPTADSAATDENVEEGKTSRLTKLQTRRIMSPSSQYAELMSLNATALKEAQGNIEEGFLKAFETLKDFQKKHATLEAEEKKLQNDVLETQVMENAELIAREKALNRRETNLEKNEEDFEKRKKQLEMREQAVDEREKELLIREKRVEKLDTAITAALGAYQQIKITKKEGEAGSNVTPHAPDTSASTSSLHPQKMSGDAQNTSTTSPIASSLPISGQAFPQGYAIYCPVVGTATAQIHDSVEEERPIRTAERSTRGHAPRPSVTVSGAMMERMGSDGGEEYLSDLEKEYRSREMLD
ncbi:hypothetical protein M409DRAFT_22313 [Zasmidium cellare ATCC 36951]|uniref:Uncharacterized protein n=1 Tax=Zasmidium cellare ATCC 36951 TaxID=1080233 RepID=A0A6A6CK22_ZASCE|nr:uncharacterized protein M409DRAFT_22313 [Zasmidium cellare ATCC 36951]KAF2167505.1 hypothetical protein M409DRAFT_22313 [Zasmidium cellare ATCC 36951]